MPNVIITPEQFNRDACALYEYYLEEVKTATAVWYSPSTGEAFLVRADGDVLQEREWVAAHTDAIWNPRRA